MTENKIPEPILIDFFKMLGPKLPKHLHISGVEINYESVTLKPYYLFKINVDDDLKKILKMKQIQYNWLSFMSKIVSVMSNEDYDENLEKILIFTEKMQVFLETIKKYFSISNIETIYV